MEVQRSFLPGSEWLYYKIYSGPKTLEHFLKNELNNLLNNFLNHKLIDKFFFIRYSDPDYHLRIRFHIQDTSNINFIIQAVRQNIEYYFSEKLIWKLCIDQYIREIERYGGSTIENIESLFFYDSMATIQIIKHVEELQDDERWMWGIKYIDLLLDKFQLNLLDKISLFENLSRNYANEFNMNKSLKIHLDNKVRNNKIRFEALFNGHDPLGAPLYNVLLQDVNCAEPIIQNIINKKKSGHLEVDFNELLSSIIHMHFNRLFRVRQRNYELVIYYFMYKFYLSSNARIKYNPIDIKPN